MTLTLLALLLMPIYLKMVLDPKRTHKLFKKLISDSNVQFMMSFWLLLLAALVLSTTGLNFTMEWASLLAWLGLLIGIKGVFYLIPGLLEKKLKWLKLEHVPFFGFIGLVFALALVYVDTQMLG
jgi:uncharacterized membrane protein